MKELRRGVCRSQEGNMRHLILIIFIAAASPVWAQGETPKPEGAHVSQAQPQAVKKEYRSKNYTVKEETDIVQKALDVFKKKSKPSSLYRKKIWLTTTLQEDNASYLSFMTNDQNENIIFSPDEDFVYYVEIGPDGERRLSGYNIVNDDVFPVRTAADSFYIETCEETRASYLVVLDGKEIEGYHVYDLEGKAIDLPDMPADVNDLKNVICY
jgi:hypothetical protein